MNPGDQAEFSVNGKGASQCEKIAATLRARCGEWVPMPDLWRASGAFAVHSRISDLRKRQGMRIEHRNEHQPDGATHSFYRLLNAEQIAAADEHAAQELADEFSQR
jgi:hypothetical protein